MMHRDTHLEPIRQCGECSTLFLKPVILEDRPVCPNPPCHAPIAKSDGIVEGAIGWAYRHILAHAGMSEAQRMHLRCLAESQMGPWDESYRLR